MSYATPSDVKLEFSKPIEDENYTSSDYQVMNGQPLPSKRFTDAKIQEALDMATAITDGTIGKWTSIPTASPVAKKLDVLWSAWFLLAAEYERATKDMGSKDRVDGIKEVYDRLHKEAMNNPEIMGGIRTGYTVYVGGS